MSVNFLSIILVISALSALGCERGSGTSGQPAENVINGSMASSSSISNIISAQTPLPSPHTSPVKPLPGVTRIKFNKGHNSGSIFVNINAGKSHRFLVGAKAGQLMDVEISSKELSINLTKGKATTTEDLGFLQAELESTGDFIVEISNHTKKDIKTAVKVTIQNSEIKEEKTTN